MPPARFAKRRPAARRVSVSLARQPFGEPIRPQTVSRVKTVPCPNANVRLLACHHVFLPTRQFHKFGQSRMARWPDDNRATLIAGIMIFALFPMLCWLTWWFVRG